MVMGRAATFKLISELKPCCNWIPDFLYPIEKDLRGDGDALGEKPPESLNFRGLPLTRSAPATLA
ncbi:MAG TPA: hypothetical protein DD473_00175 [Planctomycetaceae bacterium]|nr:hypothetical protein [Planctomycetaceae bacterium]